MRSLLVVAAALVCALCAPAFAHADTTGDVNTVRASLGLTPLAVDPVAAPLAITAATNLASDDPTGLSFDQYAKQGMFGFDQPDSCSSCDSFPSLDPLSSTDLSAVDAYHAAGGTGTLELALIPSGWTVQRILDTLPWIRPLMLDPRATTITVEPGRAGVQVIAVAADTSSPAGRTVSWPRDPVQPSGVGGLTVIAPAAAHQTVQLLERRAGIYTPLASLTDAGDGFPGSRVFTAVSGETLRLAYSTVYRIDTGAGSAVFTTAGINAQVRARGFAFHGMTAVQKQTFSRAFVHVPALVKQIRASLDGAIGISADGASRCGAGLSCAGGSSAGFHMWMNAQHLRSQFSQFVVLHEFGHIVNFLGIDDKGMASFAQAFHRSPKWKSCFSHSLGQCPPLAEIFADQFAFYASGLTNVRSGYGDPQLIARAAFGRLLARTFLIRSSGLYDPFAPAAA